MEVPEGVPKFSQEDLAKGDGLNGNPIYLGLNGKVIEYDEQHPFIKNIRRFAGGHLELMMSKTL